MIRYVATAVLIAISLTGQAWTQTEEKFRLAPGRELTYTGAATGSLEVTGMSQPFQINADLELRNLTTVTFGNNADVISFRLLKPAKTQQAQIEPPAEAQLVRLKAIGNMRLQTTDDVMTPGLMVNLFEPLLPIFKIGRENMQASLEWIVNEPPAIPIPSMGQSDVPINISHKVIGNDVVGITKCWKIERSPAGQLPLTQNVKLKANNQEAGTLELTLNTLVEHLWTDKNTGIVIKYNRSLALSVSPEGEKDEEMTLTVDLTLSLKQNVLLNPEQLSDRQKQIHALQNIQSAFKPNVIVSADDPLKLVNDAEENLKTFMNEHSDSVYGPVATNLSGNIAGLKGFLSQINSREQSNDTDGFINEPAPPFNLPNLSGKKVALSDLKGKIVLINFFFYG